MLLQKCIHLDCSLVMGTSRLTCWLKKKITKTDHLGIHIIIHIPFELLFVQLNQTLSHASGFVKTVIKSIFSKGF